MKNVCVVLTTSVLLVSMGIVSVIIAAKHPLEAFSLNPLESWLLGTGISYMVLGLMSWCSCFACGMLIRAVTAIFSFGWCVWGIVLLAQHTTAAAEIRSCAIADIALTGILLIVLLWNAIKK